ncbi:ABC transporter permease [Streptomyces alboniger]|uniref:Transport permease protein n=1 Tax=Streptomyces alboniger TaxID=132473 RepID=A0A5J6HI59_STRAD|nr:ABC transporter permease [Streptomyces alboniger]QEV18942.1 ABC transporter permease [Streptomyces alboniger]
MSTVTLTTPAGRMRALARAELTLLGRNKGTLFAALFVPVALPFSVMSAMSEGELKEVGLSVGTMVLPSAIGFSLVFAVYGSLIGVFVARREELVLKRLRTGELRDHEILVGASLPAVAIGLAQILALVAGCLALLDAGAPDNALFPVLGILLGIVMFGALAAVTASFSRTAETAQVMSMPLIFASMLGSGLAVPLEMMPDTLASVCELLPLSPVIELVRGGWTGGLSAGEALGAVATAVAWTLVSVFAVRRWFRWEPRH